ncbi:hypothetical protein V6N13_057242 [Hibiscus sabdariffa]|uniref:Uncharacterized protein n=1 Tax=Hibiscus sabdariffa TaxID=183260 RepID=A0ABR2CV31_9ROSI
MNSKLMKEIRNLNKVHGIFPTPFYFDFFERNWLKFGKSSFNLGFDKTWLRGVDLTRSLARSLLFFCSKIFNLLDSSWKALSFQSSTTKAAC